MSSYTITALHVTSSSDIHAPGSYLRQCIPTSLPFSGRNPPSWDVRWGGCHVCRTSMATAPPQQSGPWSRMWPAPVLSHTAPGGSWERQGEKRSCLSEPEHVQNHVLDPNSDASAVLHCFITHRTGTWEFPDNSHRWWWCLPLQASKEQCQIMPMKIQRKAKEDKISWQIRSFCLPTFPRHLSQDIL